MGAWKNRRVAIQLGNQRRRRRIRLAPWLAIGTLALVGWVARGQLPPLSSEPSDEPAPVEPALGPPDAAPWGHPAATLLADARLGPDGRLRSLTAEGREALLTIDPVLQQKMDWLLQDYDVPWGAVVALDPRSGRILAMAEHAAAEADGGRAVALRPIAPAASVFKVVTAAALLEAGVPADEVVCYHGGERRLVPAMLRPSSRDDACVSLADALALSANVPFARLADRHLQPERLREVAERFFFDRPLSLLGMELHTSPLELPEEPFEFARTAAGFHRGVRMTPVHGALLAAAVGTGGTMPLPRLVDAFDDVEVQEEAEPIPVIEPGVAAALGEMMVRTVEGGTARVAFRERGREVLGGMRVAGKTGSLFEYDPFRDATWFVGYAPAEAPTIAVAAVVLNEARWRIRAPYVAREAIRSHLLGTSPYRPPRAD